MMEELQDIVGGSNGKIKKFMPFIIAGAVLGGIGYLYSKNSGTQNTQSVLDDTTSKIGAIGGGGSVSSGGSSSVGQNEVVSFFAEALNQTYKQTQVDSQNLATEFRNNDATISKQLTDLTNEIHSNVVSSSVAVATQPTPTVAQTYNPTPQTKTVDPNQGAIYNGDPKATSGVITGGQANTNWGQNVWSTLWNTSAPVASAPVASSPVASAPVASAPVASAPVASAPVVKTINGKTWIDGVRQW